MHGMLKASNLCELYITYSIAWQQPTAWSYTLYMYHIYRDAREVQSDDEDDLSQKHATLKARGEFRKDVTMTVLTVLCMGVFFGICLNKSKVIDPVVIRDQFRFKRFIMLKTFCGAGCASCIACPICYYFFKKVKYKLALSIWKVSAYGKIPINTETFHFCYRTSFTQKISYTVRHAYLPRVFLLFFLLSELGVCKIKMVGYNKFMVNIIWCDTSWIWNGIGWCMSWIGFSANWFRCRKFIIYIVGWFMWCIYFWFGSSIYC